MSLISRRPKSKREPTIALINIVFLMLVFFMVAGTLTQPIDSDVRLVSTADLEGRSPPDTIVIHADERLSYRGEPIDDLGAHVRALSDADREALRLLPDRDLPAERLVALANSARAAGAKRVLIITERGLK